MHDCFSPNPLDVPVGTTVTWKNSDFTIHTITSVNSLCNRSHVTIQVATDTRQVDPIVMVRHHLLIQHMQSLHRFNHMQKKTPMQT
ncbi:MAG: hypothetical protein KGI09_03735 [Thaumarchaeota archaeon]|nr:hypothetical protein [Nitrososphaerota archaeon]MDE1877352.1 hypothetical protein [Nitrososphaerota archaeon]